MKPQAAVKHGAFSAEHLEPERKRVLGDLLASFPSVPRDRLDLAAGQRARITLLQAYVDTVGVIANRKTGKTYPAVALLAREEAAYRTELAKIEELSRGANDRWSELRAALEEDSDAGD